MKRLGLFLVLSIFLSSCSGSKTRDIQDFTQNWKFYLGDTIDALNPKFDDSNWRSLNLPHDWSIEGEFAEHNPATPGGGALPGGIGWYRKTFLIDKSSQGKRIYIDFDGVYRNSEVWINGVSVGKRPYGYISFRYDLTPYIKFGGKNVVSVRVDNSKQPNSRWYSGSGIYRNVWLTITNPIHVDLWGTFVTTPKVSKDAAQIAIQTTVRNTTSKIQAVEVKQFLVNKNGRNVTETLDSLIVGSDSAAVISQNLSVKNPNLWDIENPYMYKIVTKLYVNGKQVDEYETPIGIRSFTFDVNKGFILNGKHVKINGVCNHHDLGALGAAVNTRAIERQLKILKEMGCNAIRCSHNPPAPELLNLCDKMGFIVMDEAFDMWAKSKTTYDYSSDFPQWYERDLTDMILRDRNHPSVFIWSIGNEIVEQWSEAIEVNVRLTDRLVHIVKAKDQTRPVTAACSETGAQNPLLKSGAFDLIGFNYHHNEIPGIKKRFPTKPFLLSESVSSLQTRGFYLMPSDSINIWPETWDKTLSSLNQQCSAYDNCHAPWGSTHEETWKMVKAHDNVCGQFIWTGFDYLGEPTPYSWPSRSSFFGIVDMAGFPKDIYYMYQSEWTTKDVLHIFPHWNWNPGQVVDVWAYYNNADEVELYLNGKSLGKKSKIGDALHVWWRVPFVPGTLKAVSRKNGKEVLTREIKTTGSAACIRLTADRPKINADGKDLSFITVEVLDKDGNVVPNANQMVYFSITGECNIVGTDNGNQNDHASLKLPERHLFNGKCLVILQSTKKSGKAVLKATIDGLSDQVIKIKTR